MGGREAGDRDPEGRTRHIVEAEEVAQFDARRIPAVLAADPDLQVLADSSTLLDAGAHELADALAVQGLERIEGEDPPFHEVQEELALRVVTAVRERRLREIGDAAAQAAPPEAQHRVRLAGRRDRLEEALLLR